jgi:hypothetical protein
MNFIRFNGLEEEVGRRQSESGTAQGITDFQALLNFMLFVHNIFGESIGFIYTVKAPDITYFNRVHKSPDPVSTRT